jgi:hypothetical protein
LMAILDFLLITDCLKNAGSSAAVGWGACGRQR